MTLLRTLGLRRRRRRPREYARVAPWLLIGPALDSRGYASLADAGITHVLDLRSEASDDPAVMESLGLAWRRVPIDDQVAPTRDQMDEIVEWLEAGRGPRGEAVLYAHCQGGLGRSPTVAIALLMRRGFTRGEAHRLVVTARSVAAPTAAQDAWLAEMELGVSAASSPAGVVRPAVGDLEDDVPVERPAERRGPA